MPYDYKESWAAASTNTTQNVGSGSFSATAKRKFSIVCDTIEEANDENGVKSGLPDISSSHPRLGEGYVLNNIGLTRESPLMWTAMLSYATNNQQGGSSGEVEFELAPWNQPATVNYSTVQVKGQTEEYIDYALDPPQPKPITAFGTGDPFSVSKDYSDLQITISKAFLDYSPVSWLTYNNKTNDATFLGFPEGALKVSGIKASPAFAKKIPYWNVTVEILARYSERSSIGFERAWFAQQYNRSRLYVNTPDDFGGVGDCKGWLKSNTPILVNENGVKVDFCKVDWDNPDTDTDPFFTYFRIYPRLDFNQMNLL